MEDHEITDNNIESDDDPLSSFISSDSDSGRDDNHEDLIDDNQWLDQLPNLTTWAKEELPLSNVDVQFKARTRDIGGRTCLVYHYKNHQLLKNWRMWFDNEKLYGGENTNKVIEFQILPLQKGEMMLSRPDTTPLVLYSTTGIKWQIKGIDIRNLTKFKSHGLHHLMNDYPSALLVILFAYHNSRFPLLIQWKGRAVIVEVILTASHQLQTQRELMNQLHLRYFNDVKLHQLSNLIIDVRRGRNYCNGPHFDEVVMNIQFPPEEKHKLIGAGMLFEMKSFTETLSITAKSFALVCYKQVVCYVFNFSDKQEKFSFNYIGFWPNLDVLGVINTKDTDYKYRLCSGKSYDCIPQMFQAKYKKIADVALVGLALNQIIISQSKIYYISDMIWMKKNALPSLEEMARQKSLWPSYVHKVLEHTVKLPKRLDEETDCIEYYVSQFC